MSKFEQASDIGGRIATTILLDEPLSTPVLLWADMDPHNKQVLDRLQDPHLRAEALADFMVGDPLAARSRFESELLRRRSLRRTRRIAMVAAASVALLVGLWGGDRLFERDVQATAPAQIIFADGQVLSLDEKALNQSAGSAIGVVQTSSGAIVYPAVLPQEQVQLPADRVAMEYHTLVMPARRSYKIQLSDGSLIHLNGLSQLKYPVCFGPGERRVYLQGEAFFEVAHDPQKAFVVCAGETEIRVHGTRFNVNWRGGHMVRTLLEQGSIEVGRGGCAGVILEPGQVAEFNTVTDKCTIQQADMDEQTSWMVDEFYFKDRPLEQIMQQLESWYGVSVSYQDSDLANERFTIMIPRYVEVEKVLDLLERSSNILDFKLRDDKIKVRKR